MLIAMAFGMWLWCGGKQRTDA